MAKVRTPTEEEERIIRENGMNPASYGVKHQTETSMILLCYKTGDEIWITRGIVHGNQ